MSPEGQFWWNWWVNFGVAIATIAAVIVALFRDWIRAHLFSPKLKLQLRNPLGEKTTALLQWQTEQGLQQRTEEARYYHVVVINQVRWPTATQVQVYLLRIEEPGPDGELQVTWSGEIPIQWTHQQIYPLARTVGPAASCDLCSVVKDKWVQLHPLILPINFAVQRKGPAILVVSLQARGNEDESAISRFQIAWDGAWQDGDTEMARHLVVREITA
jgi:hypothetical protein